MGRGINIADEVGINRSMRMKVEAPATGCVIRWLIPGAVYRLRIRSSSFVGQSDYTDFIEASVQAPGNVKYYHDVDAVCK